MYYFICIMYYVLCIYVYCIYYIQDYDTIKSEHDTDKAKIAEKLQRNIGQRPDAKELVARGIAEDEKEFVEDYEKVSQAKKQEKKENKDKLNEWKRPSPQDVANKGVLNKDELPPTGDDKGKEKGKK